MNRKEWKVVGKDIAEATFPIWMSFVYPIVVVAIAIGEIPNVYKDYRKSIAQRAKSE